MERYLEFVLKKPVFTIIILFLITLGFLDGIPKLRFDNSIENMMPKTANAYRENEEMKKIYGNMGNFIIINVSADNIWRSGFFKEFDNLISDLEEYMDYDEETGNQRISKLQGFLNPGTVSVRELMNTFQDDPAFQRELSWKIDALFGETPALKTKDLHNLIESIKEIHQLKLKAQIDSILSPITAMDISGKDDTLRSYDLIKTDNDGKRILPRTPDEFNAFRKKLKANPNFEKTLYAVDPATGRITDFCILIKLKNIMDIDALSRNIWAISNSYKQISVMPQGNPILFTLMNKFMQADLSLFLPMMIAIIIIVFYFNFRSLRGVLLPTFVLIISDIWILGLMGHLGFTITPMSIALPPLMLAIGSSYSIHILNQYFIDFPIISEKGRQEGLKISMTHISVTVLLAGLTTFVGFMSLLTNQITGIRDWGLMSAIGVLFAVFIAISLIPAVLRLLPHNKSSIRFMKIKAPKKSWVDPVVKICTHLSIHHYKSVLVITAVLIIISIAGLVRINVDTSILSYFKPDNYIRVSSSIIGKKYGGFMGMSVLIDSGEQDGIMNPAYLNFIEQFREWLKSDENKDLKVGHVSAFNDILKLMNRALNNDDMAFYKVPETRETILEYIELYAGDDDNSDGRPDDFEAFLDPDYRTLMVFVRLHEGENSKITTEELRYTENKVTAYLNKNLPAPYKFKIVGEPSIFISASDYIIKGQVLSMLFCLVTVCVMVFLLFRNWKAGLISSIPMGVAIIFNFGVMGWLKINLDSSTAMIASITIGIGIDDTIHFLNTYRHFSNQSSNMTENITKTLAISGKAITYTSIALIFGFSVLTFSTFVPVVLFGALIAFTMVATTIGALIILPATIIATNISLDEMPADSLAGRVFWRYMHLGKLFRLSVDE